MPGPHRLVLCAAAALAFMVPVGCSSGSDDKESTKEYCAEIQTVYDTASPYATASTFPPEVRDEIGEQLFAALKAAPPDVQTALGHSILGDPYARDDFDQFNRANCNIDTSTIKAQ